MEERLTPGNITKKFRKIASGADSNVYLDKETGKIYKVYYCNNLPGVNYSEALLQVEAYMDLINQASQSQFELMQDLLVNGSQRSIQFLTTVNPIIRINEREEDSLNIPVTESDLVQGYSLADYCGEITNFSTPDESDFAEIVKLNKEQIFHTVRELSRQLQQQFSDRNVNITPMNIKLYPEFDDKHELLRVRMIITDLKAQVVKISLD